MFRNKCIPTTLDYCGLFSCLCFMPCSSIKSIFKKSLIYVTSLVTSELLIYATCWRGWWTGSRLQYPLCRLCSITGLDRLKCNMYHFSRAFNLALLSLLDFTFRQGSKWTGTLFNFAKCISSNAIGISSRYAGMPKLYKFIRTKFLSFNVAIIIEIYQN